MTYERITIGDVQVGDRIARTRSGPFHEVVRVSEGPLTRTLFGHAEPGPWFRAAPGARADEWIIMRPRRQVKLWRMASNH